MFRLDSLSQKELNKLYTRSSYLSQLGTLGMLGLLAVPLLVFLLSPWWLLIAVPSFAVSYVFLYVRSKPARIYFYVWSVCSMISSVLIIWAAAHTYQFISSSICFVIGGIIFLWLSIEVFRSAKTDALFDPNGYTHKQIALARKKKRKNDFFADEDLPKKLPHPILSKVCVVIAFIWEAIIIIETVVRFFSE